MELERLKAVAEEKAKWEDRLMKLIDQLQLQLEARPSVSFAEGVSTTSTSTTTSGTPTESTETSTTTSISGDGRYEGDEIGGGVVGSGGMGMVQGMNTQLGVERVSMEIECLRAPLQPCHCTCLHWQSSQGRWLKEVRHFQSGWNNWNW